MKVYVPVPFTII